MSKRVFKEEEIILHPSDERKNIYICFNAPEGTEKLYIAYSYSPKILEDKEKSVELIRENILRDAPEDFERYKNYDEFLPLKNLVTLSLDSPVDFRGAAHRHDEVQLHEIGKDYASPGFLKGELESGEWRLSLNVHALITDECICRVKVEGEVRE